jgi:hypothetical protein
MRLAIVAVYPCSNGDIRNVVELVRRSLRLYEEHHNPYYVTTAFYIRRGATLNANERVRRRLVGMYHLYEDTMRDLYYSSIDDKKSHARHLRYVRLNTAGVELLLMSNLHSPNFVDVYSHCVSEPELAYNMGMLIFNVLVTDANYIGVVIWVMENVLRRGERLLEHDEDTSDMMIMIHSYDHSAPVTHATHECATRLHRILDRLLCTTYVYFPDESTSSFRASDSIGDHTEERSMEYADTFEEVDSNDTHLSYVIRCTIHLPDWSTPGTPR